jgi:Ribonuclease-III-like/Double-stranded RNA binding motif
MVNTNTLALLAEQLDMGSYLYLGKGIAKGGGRSLKSLLANMFEAVLGAVFLDAGYDAAYHYYLNRYRSLPSPAQDENFKGRLQQVAQERFGETPFYDSEGARVGNHREYTSVVFAGSEPLGTGHGPTKQEAEQEAARVALEGLVGTSSAKAVAKPAARPRAPRAPRAPRTPRAPAAEASMTSDEVSPGTSAAEALAEVFADAMAPEPDPAPPRQPVVEAGVVPEPPAAAPRRSRQFGEPLE